MAVAAGHDVGKRSHLRPVTGNSPGEESPQPDSHAWANSCFFADNLRRPKRQGCVGGSRLAHGSHHGSRYSSRRPHRIPSRKRVGRRQCERGSAPLWVGSLRGHCCLLVRIPRWHMAEGNGGACRLLDSWCRWKVRLRLHGRRSKSKLGASRSPSSRGSSSGRPRSLLVRTPPGARERVLPPGKPCPL